VNCGHITLTRHFIAAHGLEDLGDLVVSGFKGMTKRPLILAGATLFSLILSTQTCIVSHASGSSLDEVRLKIKDGKYAEAEALADRLVRQQPSGKGYELLGYVYESQQKLANAEHAYGQALQLEPQLSFSSIRLGIVHAKQREFKKSIESLEASLSKFGPSAELIYYLCLSHLEEKNAQMAVNVASEMEQFGPEALLSVVRLLVWKELYPQSLPLLKKTVEQLPQSSKAHYLYALSLFKTGQYEDIRSHIEKAYQLDPTSVPVLLLYATDLLRENRFTEAKSYIKKAQSLDPSESKAEYLLALALIGEEAYDAAAQTLQALSRRYPDLFEPRSLLLQAYRKKGDISATLECGQKLAEDFPESFEAQLNSGLDLDAATKFPQAEQAFRKALALAPNDRQQTVKVKVNLGKVLVKEGKDEEALSVFQSLINAYPDEITARVELADILLRTGQWEEVLQVLGSALRSDPKNKRIHLLMGKALTRLNRHEEAQEHFKTFHELEVSQERP